MRSPALRPFAVLCINASVLPRAPSSASQATLPDATRSTPVLALTASLIRTPDFWTEDSVEFNHPEAGIIARRLARASRLRPSGIGRPSHFIHVARGQGYAMVTLRSLAEPAQ